MEHTKRSTANVTIARINPQACKLGLLVALTVVGLCGVSAAKDPLPDAPSAVSSSASTSAEFFVEAVAPAPMPRISETNRVVDLKFTTLALISAGSTFADSYTTLFARQNWLAGKTNVCNEEVQSAYLYGTHPTVARAYAVASAKTVTSVFTAYYLRKHHSRFWSAPLIANAAISLEGVTQNMMACN
jgi:hypothetical protein